MTDTSPGRDDARETDRGIERDRPGDGVSARQDGARPISGGPDARARPESIVQTERALPDDTGRPVDIAPEEVRRIARRILGP